MHSGVSNPAFAEHHQHRLQSITLRHEINMAKKKAARRTGRQNGAGEGRSSASTSAPVPQPLVPRVYPKPTLAVGTTTGLPPRAGYGSRNDILHRPAVAYALDVDDALEATRAPFGRQITSTQDDFDRWYPPGCYSSIPSRDSHIAFLFTRLYGAITHPTMDFDEILAEIRVLTDTLPPSSPSGQDGRDPRHEIPHQSITAPVNSGSTHIAINIDKIHGFRANAAPRRQTHSEASISSSRGPLSWATVR